MNIFIALVFSNDDRELWVEMGGAPTNVTPDTSVERRDRPYGASLPVDRS
jgi:hypothetical protein